MSKGLKAARSGNELKSSSADLLLEFMECGDEALSMKNNRSKAKALSLRLVNGFNLVPIKEWRANQLKGSCCAATLRDARSLQ